MIILPPYAFPMWPFHRRTLAPVILSTDRRPTPFIYIYVIIRDQSSLLNSVPPSPC